jgi:hypothetical protein
LDSTAFFSFTLTPIPGYKIDFENFVYTGQASENNPVISSAFRSSRDGFVANIGTTSLTGTTIDLRESAFQSITSAIEFRFFAWGDALTGVSSTFSINDFTFNGEVTAVPEPTSIVFGGILSAAGWVALRRRRKVKQATQSEATII